METNKVKDVKDVYLQPQIEVVEMEMQEGVLADTKSNQTEDLNIVTGWDAE